jgi:thiol-disulfide isomerase/thioredoxin
MARTRVRNPLAVLVVGSVLAGLVVALVLSIATDDGDGSDAEPAVLTLAPDGEEGPVPQVDLAGEAVPDFAYASLRDGDESSFEALRDGRPALVNFFFKRCPPCVTEMPALQDAYEEFGDRVAFLGLSYQESVDDGLDLVERTGVTYEVGRDAAGDIFTQLSGIGFPTTVFVAADGTVVTAHTGRIRPDELRDELEGLVS